MCLKEDEDSEPAQWRKLAKERVSRSVDAALVILLVGEHCRFDAGSVYQEESIEVLIQVLNFQLQSSIFPEYDSYYRLSSEKKGKLSYPSQIFPLTLGVCTIYIETRHKHGWNGTNEFLVLHARMINK